MTSSSEARALRPPGGFECAGVEGSPSQSSSTTASGRLEC
eukprot:CAMPEP_0182909660 /NCGR_PEP_ID=MMETSP0034_2-20130328/35880_1 /TAXON_ID=156128 /ORGANISM="Nephroselmis pyriformis, Strain CCMP717" /LENGTH=39 /DNA_ID= /DNA_START= /DNA_END= /DNA_ORIENTATION=